MINVRQGFAGPLAEGTTGILLSKLFLKLAIKLGVDLFHLEVLILADDGTEGTFDMNRFLQEEGLQGARVNYNTPQTALENDTPVDVLDRLKLAFGNAKGGVNYLKNKFEDATVNEDGKLLVKDKGVWQAVDPEGITRGDGWSFSEVIGDLADISRDVLMGGAQLAGAAAAGAGTLGTGAAAGAVGAAAAASAASAAVGRIIGTYDATPEEVVKDVAMDTLLAAAGETVALGAKNAVLPAIKSMWSKVGSASDASKSIMKGAARDLLGLSDEAASVAFDESAAVARTLDRITESANMPQSLLKGAAQQNVEAGSFNAIKLAADNEMAQAMKPLAVDAQENLSRMWRSDTAKMLSQVPKDYNPKASTLVSDGITEFQNAMTQLGVFKNTRGAGPQLPQMASAQEIAAKLGVTAADAQALQKTGQSFLNQARGWVDESAGLKGKEAAANLMSMLKNSQDLVSSLPAGTTQGSELLNSVVSGFHNKLAEAFPKKIGDMTGSEALLNIRRRYAERVGAVEQVKGMLRGSGKSFDTAALDLAAMYGNKARGDGRAQILFDTLAEMHPNGQQLMQRAKLVNAVKEWRTQGSQGMWGSVQGAARRMGIPAINTLTARAVRPATYMMSQTGKAIRAMGVPMLADSDKLGAMLTMAAQGMR